MTQGPQIVRGRQRARWTSGAFIALAVLAADPAGGAAPAVRTNWFHDPFFSVSRDIAPCPEPLGPLVTEDNGLRAALPVPP